MANFNEKIDYLKQKISSATKIKILKDVDGLKLRNIERQYSEELSFIDSEIEFSTEQLKDLKSKISVVRHQISLVEICRTTEKTKTRTHIADLYNRKRSFDDVFNKVRQEAELRKKEQKQDEQNEQELLRQREHTEMQKVDELAKETDVVEKQCEAFERECAVLKKRNNAMMLKMRRKLVETENIRKDLLKTKHTA